MYICSMTVKEYLKTSPYINVSAIAKRMYPGNSDAPAYLIRKLGDRGRPFTEKDTKLAYDVLRALGVELMEVTEHMLGE